MVVFLDSLLPTSLLPVLQKVVVVYGYRPTTRLLSMLELLQARGRLGGPELTRRLEVSERTVRRYAAIEAELTRRELAEREPTPGRHVVEERLASAGTSLL